MSQQAEIPLIGGEQDGRYTSARAPQLEAAIRQRLPTYVAVDDITTPSIPRERYFLESLTAGGKVLFFYRHDSVMVEDALRALLNNYRKPAPR